MTTLREALPGAIRRTRQDATMVTVAGRRGLVVDPEDLADLLVAAERLLELDPCAAGTCDHDDGPTEAELDTMADVASGERPF